METSMISFNNFELDLEARMKCREQLIKKQKTSFLGYEKKKSKVQDE